MGRNPEGSDPYDFSEDSQSVSGLSADFHALDRSGLSRGPDRAVLAAPSRGFARVLAQVL